MALALIGRQSPDHRERRRRVSAERFTDLAGVSAVSDRALSLRCWEALVMADTTTESSSWIEAALKLGSGWVLAAYLVWQLTSQFSEAQKETIRSVGLLQLSM